jgi:hypothetical protein
MTLSLTHKLVVAIADDVGAKAAGEVVPSSWNDQHALTGAANALIGFDNGGNAVEIAAGANITIAGNQISAAGGAGSPGGSSGQVQYNNGGAFGGFTLGGDATLNTSTGALAVTKTNGVSFGALATPIGGVNSIAPAAHSWIAYVDTSGLPHQSQPAFADLSGSAGAAQLPDLGTGSQLFLHAHLGAL